MVAICGHPGFPVRGGLKAEIREGHGAGQEELVTASRRDSGRAQGESDGGLTSETSGSGDRKVFGRSPTLAQGVGQWQGDRPEFVNYFS